MYLFKSERLGFRFWCESDKEPFAQMNRDAQVMEYFPELWEIERSFELVDLFNDRISRKGYGWFAVDRLDTKEFIGFIGLNRLKFELPWCPCEEIGWRLKPEHWKQGFATEGAFACLEYGFNELGFDKVYAITATLNKPSERVMLRIGMEYVQDFEHPKVPEGPLKTHMLYSIQKPSG